LCSNPFVDKIYSQDIFKFI